MELSVERHELAFGSPLRTSYGTLDRRELALVSLVDAQGVTGRGDLHPGGDEPLE